MNMTSEESNNFTIPDCTVVIPTRHRATCVTAAKLFPDALLVVEPHDAENYRRAGFRRLLVLPADDMGIGRVRNFILENAARRILMCDDDIDSLCVLRERKVPWLYYRADSSAATKLRTLMFRYLGELGGAYAGPIFRRGSRLANGKVRLWAIVGLNAPALRAAGCCYRHETDLFEDFDFQLQAMAAGLRVGALCDVAFGCPTCGSNKGGLNDGDAVGRSAARQRRSLNALCGFWDFIDVSAKARGFEPKIQWAKMALRVEEMFFPGAG